jgi:hypothetical protein
LSADPSSSYNYLGEVYCNRSTDCTAVGTSCNSSDTPQTAVETASGNAVGARR